jgi:signal transduction histidine kinase
VFYWNCGTFAPGRGARDCRPPAEVFECWVRKQVTPDEDGETDAVRESRSIIFYAWAGLAIQSVLTAAVIAFVLAGAAYQRSAIEQLRGKIQAVQVVNLATVADFLDTQRAVAGYQATGQGALLRGYRPERNEFEHELANLSQLAWPMFHGELLAEERTARSVFLADDRAVAAPRGSAAGARSYARAQSAANTFTSQAGVLRQRLAEQGAALAVSSERTLGVGLGWTAAILAIGLMLPVIAVALGLRWVSGPLHDVTTVVRRRALGDAHARAVPGGPADVRDLATSINFLADESDRITDGERERARLQAEVRQASVRIREHLRADAIIREAVTAIHEHLPVAFVWVGVVTGERLALADGGSGGRDDGADPIRHLPPDAIGWIRDIYRHRSSYRVQDLDAVQAGEIPAEIRKILLSQGATALLLTPFGAGQELLGCLTLLRTSAGQVWTQPEIEAVESLAGDIGRGLEHARLYEGEERLVAELESLASAKASFLASASHDLRTPLTSIIGYVELLADAEAGPIRPAQAKMLDGVDRNARRLKTMIEDMLTISKIELGAFTSRLQPLDLAGLLPPAADVIRPSAGAGGLSFQVSCPEHPVMVDGDPEQLDRLLINLLSNAVKYTPRGGSVALTLDSDAGSAVMSVADTGIGIPEEDQKALFTRFFRASNAVEAAIPGSGLGLSIVRTIVANHHGELSIKSARDQGTTVTVRIPLDNGAVPAQAGDIGRHIRQGQPEGLQPEGDRTAVGPTGAGGRINSPADAGPRVGNLACLV